MTTAEESQEPLAAKHQGEGEQLHTPFVPEKMV